MRCSPPAPLARRAMAALGEVARFDNPVGGAEHEQRGALADVEAALARGGV